jgi:hypothetical protein
MFTPNREPSPKWSSMRSVSRDDRNPIDAGSVKGVEDVLEKRPPADRQHGLGDFLGQILHSGAAASGQHHRVPHHRRATFGHEVSMVLDGSQPRKAALAACQEKRVGLF